MKRVSPPSQRRAGKPGATSPASPERRILVGPPKDVCRSAGDVGEPFEGVIDGHGRADDDDPNRTDLAKRPADEVSDQSDREPRPGPNRGLPIGVRRPPGWVRRTVR